MTGATGAGAPDAGEPLRVVVVAYGPPDPLARCLAALGPGLAVTVVDNSTSAETRRVVDAAGATYVDPGANIGFAAAVNLALARTGPPGADVLLVNPDAVVSPAAVRRLRQRLQQDFRAACVAPQLRHPDGTPERAGWQFPTPARAWGEALGFGRFQPSGEFVTGAVLLLRGAALEELGGFDERFFLYGEEVDWQQRAVRAGWHAALAADVEAEHVGAGTVGDHRWREAMFHSSVERYIRKWHGATGFAAFRLAVLAGAAVRAAVLPGDRRRAARQKFALYWHGPVAAAERLGAARD